MTADDFGLTRGITDTILQASDNGALTRVSIIPNGYAVDYALNEWRKRSGKLSLSIHLNLTEGKALSNPMDIPHLVDSQGMFRHSPFSFLVRTLCALPSTRRAIMTEVENEFTAQIEYVRARVGGVRLAVDGHQHAHIIPLVFSGLLSLHRRYNFESIRLPCEPFFFDIVSWRRYLSLGLLRHMALNFFSRTLKGRVLRDKLPHPDFFISTLMSGQLILSSVASALGEALRRGGNVVEIGFHPGTARPGELEKWKGDTAWQYSSWRMREQELIQSPKFMALTQSFLDGTLSSAGSRALEVWRFVIAGVIATGTNLGLLYALTDFLGLWYVVSVIIAYGVATGISFTLQKFWTFSHYSLERVRRETVLYILNNLLGVVFDVGGLYILVEYAGVWYMVAQFVLLALIAIWNFFVFRFFIFPAQSKN